MSAAREEILDRVRTALSDVPAGDPDEDASRERDERSSHSHLELVALFCERTADYRAEVRRVGSGEVASALAAACAQRDARRLVAPASLPDAWRPDGVELVADEDLSSEQLDAADGVISGCALGIAETGTFVLDGGDRQGRRALSLLPDLHLCVIEASQVVADVPEALEALEPAAREGRPITFVSGPSATSDIELQRVEGVHGPRDLVVLVVE